MALLNELMRYAAQNPHTLVVSLRTHVALSATAILVACLACIPLGIWTSRHAAGAAVIGVVNGLRAVPSLAVLALVLPLLGLGFSSALVALILLACPPILINTDLAYRGVDPAVKEAAAGMGMRPIQALRRVETPLALGVIVTGVRTASVEVIASATLAAFIGGGGLGDLIVQGLEVNDVGELVLGAAVVGALAIVAEASLGLLARVTSIPQSGEVQWAR